MSDELETLKTVAHRLDEASIPYMITGSVAMNFYATPRMTRDIDVVIELSKEDTSRMVELFKSEFYIDDHMVSEAIRDRGIFNIIHNKTGVKIDFVVRKHEPYRKVEFGRRRKTSGAGFAFWLVAPEDLVLSKLYWAKESESELQMRDVKNILEGPSKIDFQYVETWAKELGLLELYRKIKN